MITKDEQSNFIVTDKDVLRKPSLDLEQKEFEEVSSLLLDHLSGEELGLSACQIGVHKNAFSAFLSNSVYIFINPEFESLSPDKRPSIEGCLSLPGITWCCARHNWVRIKADSIRKYRDPISGIFEEIEGPIKLTGLDATVVQHETDHLNGILMIDRPAVDPPASKQERARAFRERALQKKRQKRRAERKRRRRGH